MVYTTVADHRSMALDERRNQIYADALQSVVTNATVVLDLGAGLGVHGLLAAKLGAKHTHLVEPEPVLQIAKKIAAANGLAESMSFYQDSIEAITLPEPVDVIVSVFTGNFLLTEDLLPLLFLARDRWLAPDGVLLPNQAVMRVVPVTIPEYYQHHLEQWSVPHFGLDLSAARQYVSNTVLYHHELRQAHYLAEPADLHHIDFMTATDTSVDAEITLTIIEDGLCHGIVGWFDAQVGATWLSTAPHEPQLHWRPAFLALDPPLPVKAGETLHFHLLRPTFGEWTWLVRYGDHEQQHSSFYALPLTLPQLQKLSLDYQPNLNQHGQVVQFVLNCTNNSLTTHEIVEVTMQQFPSYFVNQDEARNFVHNLIRKYG